MAKKSEASKPNPDALLNALSVAATPDLRILHRIKPQRVYGHANGQPTFRGLAVDTETTGLDTSSDLLIEIALIPFLYTEDGTITEVLVDEIYTGTQDPGFELSDEVRELTGIQNSDIAGTTFDLEAIKKVVEPCNLLIAHHAAFDRPMLERLLPIFATKYWACSLTQIPWRREGFLSGKLELIALGHGLFFDAHRAKEDALALIHLLALPLPVSDRNPIAVIRENLSTQRYNLWTGKTPYELKDRLYSMGYRWREEIDPTTRQVIQRCHRKETDQNTIEADLEALLKLGREKNIAITPKVVPVEAIDLFSIRA